jgi:nucleoside-diphosphate-sugar epimerase
MAETLGAKGRTYLAGDEHTVTLTKLVRGVAKSVGGAVRILRWPWYDAALLGLAAASRYGGRWHPATVFRRTTVLVHDQPRIRIDRAKSELGHSPRILLSEGLQPTAEWYRGTGYLGGSGSRRPRPCIGGCWTRSPMCASRFADGTNLPWVGIA